MSPDLLASGNNDNVVASNQGLSWAADFRVFPSSITEITSDTEISVWALCLALFASYDGARYLTSSWPHCKIQLNGGVAQSVRTSDCHAADAGSVPWCSKGFFSQSQLSVKILLRVSVHSRVQSHALTSVRMLKIL